jgi:hypothetical protein
MTDTQRSTPNISPKQLGVGYSYLAVFAGLLLCILSRTSYSGGGFSVGNPGQVDKELNWFGLGLVASGLGGRATIARKIGEALPNNEAIAAVGKKLLGESSDDSQG